MITHRWFADQLGVGSDLFTWALAQVRGERRDAVPPPAVRLGTWSATRHAFHLLHYERTIALPSMRQWSGGALLTARDVPDEDAAWGGGQDVVEVVRELRRIREQEIALAAELADDLVWHEIRDALWGRVSLHWVVTKTLQHTAEHTHDVLSLALFWP